MLSAIISAIAGGWAARRQSDATVESARVAAQATVQSALSAARSDSGRLRYEIIRRRVEMFDNACLAFLEATRDPDNASSAALFAVDEVGIAAELVCGPQYKVVHDKLMTFVKRAHAWCEARCHELEATLGKERAESERPKRTEAGASGDCAGSDISDKASELTTEMRFALCELCSAVDKIAIERIDNAFSEAARQSIPS